MVGDDVLWKKKVWLDNILLNDFKLKKLKIKLGTKKICAKKQEMKDIVVGIDKDSRWLGVKAIK